MVHTDSYFAKADREKMRKFSTQMHMIHVSIWDKMIIFAFPLALTGMLQQLFNGADVGILGKFVGGSAMSAVGTNVPIIGLIVSVSMGLAIGANVVIARFLGMREEEQANRAVSTAFVTAVGLGIGLTVLGEAFAGLLLDLIGVPEDVRPYAESYLRVYLLGLPFIVTFNFLAAVLRSHGDTQTPLFALLIASVFNILANLWFVLVMDMDTGGVAFATVLSNVISSGILLNKLFHSKGALHLSLKNLFVIDRHSLHSMIRIGWPAALQSSVFSLSNLIVQSAINSLGSDAIAGSAGAFIIEINIYCFINAFGLA
ncbi:MAG: polysaccharide biosynthesis C-terminal domain-containing protein, partial [Burkholderiales bacterium]|nr:polysaccharide biosynthesis C-terminal domain-containing protein [Burkholderiales bacterium]